MRRDGFLFLPKVLPPALTAQLRADLDWVLESNPADEMGGSPEDSIHFHPRLFELSAANLSLFELEPICSFAEALISPNCHVVHNNSFKSRSEGGGISGW